MRNLRSLLALALTVTSLACAPKQASHDAGTPEDAGASPGLDAGSIDAGTDAGSGTASAVIGTAGGEVSTGGSSVTLPPGAVSGNVTITAMLAPNAPPPPNVTTVGMPVTFGPEGQQFLVPVTVTLDFDPAELPAGKSSSEVVVFTAPVGTTDFVALATTLTDSTHVSAQTTHFSTFVPGVSDGTDGGTDGGAADAGDAGAADAGNTPVPDGGTAADGGALDAGVALTAPAGLAYATNPAVLTVGRLIVNDTPAQTGGAAASWSVAPALPSGLVFDTTTGTISGTPGAVLARTSFTVTATNAAGSATTMLGIIVNDVAPSSLTYATNPVGFTLGEQIPDDAPSSSGGAVVTYDVLPTLPSGLSLDTSLGVISGTPTELSPAADYLVTATNTGGSTSVTVNITVVDVPPTGLSYATNPLFLTKGIVIATDVPLVSGGAVLSYSIVPLLPLGLFINPSAGVITGTPRSLSPQTSYVVTAANSGGSTTAMLSITVNAAAPAAVTYPVNPAVFTLGQTISDDVPTNSGGVAVSYGISPTPPAGLTFSATTGTLSGTPTALAPTATYTVTATNTGGTATATLAITVNDVAPSALTYATNPVAYTLGQVLTPNTPAISGGTVVSWSVNPTLPGGLSLDPVAGTISGTPTVLAPQASYVVTATNSGGSATVSLTLTVNDVAPSSLTYAASAATFTKGRLIPSDSPSSSGGPVVSYSITPPLPAGLVLDPVAGVVSGTPLTTTAMTSYTVTATNSGGLTTTTLTLTVVDVIPSVLAYLTNPAVYTLGQQITANTPSSSGGAIIAYAISPVLPAGLSLDATTGILSGTPTALSVQTDYTVTATNSGGFATVTLTLTVNDVAPSALTYAPNPAIYTLGKTIDSNAPSTSGGLVVSWSVTPPLPAGLSFDTTTGIVSGASSALSTETDYTVTATNTGGFTTATLTITVNAMPPSSLTYPQNPAVFTINQPITDDGPENSAGIVSYSITPPLPAGLDFDTGTGILSGTAIVLSPAAYYTVTATNSGGATSATLSVAVVDVPASGLTYPTNPAIFTKGKAIVSDVPATSSGGPVVSWAIAPPLPTGLLFDTTTGIVSGVPTVLSVASAYTVTATNSGGFTTATLTITVNDVPPANLTYAINPAVYTLNETIDPNGPANSTGVISYAITPPLPAGLSLDTTTGILSGTPTALSPAANYTVTATNSGGFTNANLSLTVVDVAPSALAYAMSPVTCTLGRNIASDALSASGGPIVSFSINPPLPGGLSFDPSSGTISGTPGALSPATTYTVTATNSGGSSTVTLTLAVVDVPPSLLTYATNPIGATLGQLITSDVPSAGAGGAIVSWSISPTLPAGLSFDPTTGIVSGTPSSLNPETDYTVTATNSGGFATVTLDLTVDDVGPKLLTYAVNPTVYTLGRAIAPNNPSTSGGAIISWSISAPLPAGLFFDPTSGIISGTPAALSVATSYTVTATNSGGSTTASLTLTVNDVAPSNLSYPGSPFVVTSMNGVSQSPTSSGGAVVSYSITPPLPGGLSFNTSNGSFAGMTNALQTATVYTVTATNSGGFTTGTFSLTINDRAPAGLTYLTNPATYTLNVAITGNTPSSSLSLGGAIVSYAVSPPLPAGLRLSTATGVLSGTPTAITPTATYTITGTNTGGSTAATLVLTVNDAKPTSLQYSMNPATYDQGMLIANNVPSNSGGAILSYSVFGSLPAGLILDPTTGTISGTPITIQAATNYTITGTNSGGMASVAVSITVVVDPPVGLSYSTNPVTYTKGQAITTNSPTLTGGGAVTTWGVSPGLPAGLVLNPFSGTITGVPTALAPAASYVVTASNGGGSTMATLNITVKDQPPGTITYQSPVAYTKGQLAISDVPSESGGPPVSWSISPPLPTGLTFSTTTGAIGGTPTVLSPATSYTVTGTNTGGPGTGTVTIAVNDVVPSALIYTAPTATFVVGMAITSDVPTSSGGAVVSYSISPPLPAGLGLSTTTGVISGTPTVVAPLAIYTVTATNSGGFTTATLTFTVNDIAPASLIYLTSLAVYRLNVLITSNTPSNTGGAIVSYAITPTLPAGLTLSTTTGIISGTPTVLSAAQIYTVTGTNTGGPVQGALSIAVIAAAPAGLTYSKNPAVYTLNEAITSNTPTASGGAVASWSINPTQLPAGLSFSTSTGTLTGTPTALAQAANFVVTATNTGGSTTATLSVAVIDVPPLLTSYLMSPAVYTQFQAITPNTPIVSGGPVVGWSITPTLPTGLDFSDTTGIITGTPIGLFPAVGFTITATNTGGPSVFVLSIAVVDVLPSVTYPTNPAVFTRGLAITPDVPSNSGGAVVSYAVSPPLPTGLSLNPATGVLSGTPTTVSSLTAYTVIATNTGGPNPVTLTLTVRDLVPIGLAYSANPIVYPINVPITPNVPTTTGGGVASSWTVSPPLPAGLSFSTTTGIITGTPSALAAPTTYTVNATNSAGSDPVTLTLSVINAAPSNVQYAHNPVVYTINEAITPDTATSQGGAVVSWAITPVLPDGMIFSTTTGTITGTPDVLSLAANYTVTATNSGGPSSVSLSVAVVDVAPVLSSYTLSPAVYTQWAAILPNAPVTSGGAVVSYSVTPPLPTGLSLDDMTGIITGAPIGLWPAAEYSVTATNSGGPSTFALSITVDDVPPAVTYTTNPVVFTKGALITSDLPVSTGGAVLSYAINPALPTGLSFDTTTGIVSGTPTVLSSLKSYTVTATNTGGPDPITLIITVNDAMPTGLAYSLNPAAYTKGATITNTPSTTGGGAVLSYSITPPLPLGLSFSTTTGVISGAPTVLAAQATYTVTATNSGGSDPVSLVLAVNDVAPSGLAYSQNPVAYRKGTLITINTASTTGGGPVVSYAITPPLPGGLSFDTTTGTISGTPTTLAAQATYTVTATNSGGPDPVSLLLTVNDVAPSITAYLVNPATYAVGQSITINTPTTSGGAVVSWAITPPLSAGLGFSTSTGVISGTPTAAAALTPYAITATNSGGPSAPITLNITVNVAAPAGLTYSSNPVTYVKGTPITNTPSSTGGAIASYAVAPPLPGGLSLDPTQGVISGNPTTVTALATYVVTGTNVTSTTTASVMITVNDIAPSGLTYTVSSPSYTKGVLITPDMPSNSGGTIVSYAIAPPLPTGLTLSTSTGIISGTPTALQSSTMYTVTGTNTGAMTTAVLHITVNDQTPAITYSANPASYNNGQAIVPNVPTNTGGAVVTWSISPPLPTGLSFNTSNGNITGTPTQVIAQTTYTVTATNTGGPELVSLLLTVNQVVPAIAYPNNPATYTYGQLITSNTPTNTGGVVSSYSISPPLSAGLSFSTSTGVISGTPTAPAALTAYTVTATNSAGPDPYTLMLTVLNVVPSGLAYATSPAVFKKGVLITSDIATTTGGGPVTTWSISPTLPTGLIFDPSTGTISGTPTVVSALTPYTVTASNSAGPDMIILNVTVNDVAPSSLTYTVLSPLYMTGTAITPDSPSSSGGLVVSYAVSPALPSGLSLNTTSGVISGTPTAAATAASYLVTATNSGGFTTVTLNITVKDLPPSGLSYATSAATYFLGVAISSNLPSSSGGAVVSYSVSPPLPAGLSLDPSAGIISGTPTLASPSTSYTITATNSGGTTTAMITIVVYGQAPANLSYSGSGGTYAIGATITPLTATTSGGPVTSWAISPALPALTFNTTNGTISGIATNLSQTTVYTVTASNPIGSAQATLTITVQGTTGLTNVIAAGELHACAIVNGGVQCWGRNSEGQLGNNSTTAANTGIPVPVQVFGLTAGVQAIAASAFNNCALVNGGVQCWGNNLAGQLGTGTTVNSTVPVQVSGLTSGVQALALSGDSSCALVNGGVQCWGLGGNGELGNNSTAQSNVPVQVQGLTTGVQAIAGHQTAHHFCAIVGSGVQCWGLNQWGQLGDNVNVGGQSDVPVAVTGLTNGVQALAVSSSNSCAIVNGGVQCWGLNSLGQLGNNSTVESNVPVQVSGLTSGVQAISCDQAGACALLNGGVQCWGSNGSGQLGNNSGVTQSNVPVQVSGLTGAQAISGGALFECALVNGGVKCWGSNPFGALGNNTTTSGPTPAPVQVQGLVGGVQSVTLGIVFDCALVSGGVQCWGDNSNGALGNNNYGVSSTAPVRVSGLSSGVEAVSAGSLTACAIVQGGVQCWGYNGEGELGNGSTNDSAVPVQVTGLTSGVEAISLGWATTCALVGGGVKCWGDNSLGELGNGTTISSAVPVQVTGLTTGVTALASTSWLENCAIVNGGVQCWGYNQFDELGNNSETNSALPVVIAGLSSGVTQVAIGQSGGCAIVNGGVQCWGALEYGSLGNGDMDLTGTVTANVPVQVLGLNGTGLLSGVTGLTPSYMASCALADGAAVCWGYDADDGLGDDGASGNYSPYPVQATGLSGGVQTISGNLNTGCVLVNGNVQCWGTNNDQITYPGPTPIGPWAP